MGIDGVADGTIRYSTKLLDILNSRFHIVHIVERIEDSHDTQPRGDGVATETFDDLVGVGTVAKQISSTRQGGQFGSVANGRLDLLQTIPRTLVEVAHHGVWDGTSPYLHGIKSGIFVIGQDTVNL